jgi:hypothetical protein
MFFAKTGITLYPMIQYPQFQLSTVYHGPPKKLENYINKRFISFKMPAKQEQAMTW